MSLRKNRGFTVVEMLVVMGILGIVLLVTSSGIIQALQVNRIAEDASNTQSKLRRITEVVTQELRSAVLGGIVNYPYTSGSDSISFTLMAGDGGLAVVSSPTGNQVTQVYADSVEALDSMVGSSAILIGREGASMVIPVITGRNYSSTGATPSRLSHSGCTVTVPYEVDMRIFRAIAMGFTFDVDDGTLYQTIMSGGVTTTVPFAFDLESFALEYVYSSGTDTIIQGTPATDGAGNPQPSFLSGGDNYSLARLKLTIRSVDDGDRASREYVSYIELTGLGNENRPVTSLESCG